MIAPWTATGQGRWLALGRVAADHLREALPPGRAVKRAGDVHQAISLLAGERFDGCLAAADALGGKPRAALRALLRYVHEGRLFVARTPGADRAVRAAESLGVPVVEDAFEATVDAPAPARDLPRADAVEAELRGTEPPGSEAAAFAEGVLRRVERPRALARFVLDAFVRASGARRASLLLREPGRSTLRVQGAVGLPQGLVGKVRCSLGAGLAGRAASLGRPLVGRGAVGGPRGYDGSTYVVLPLAVGSSSGNAACEGVVCLSEFPADRLPDMAQVGAWVRMARQAGRALRAARRLRRAETLSARDRLTGLANRRAFERALEREAERARRSGLPLAVALFDVDHFKQVNDVHGHAAGDLVLVEVARRFKDTLRETDLVARWGGEEFAVLLTGVPEDGGAESRRVLERLRESVAEVPVALSPGQGSYRLTVSAGYSLFAPRQGDARDRVGLLKAVDDALYAAKTSGRNNVQAG